MRIERFDPWTEGPEAGAYCAFVADARVASHPKGLSPPPAYTLNVLRHHGKVHETRVWTARDGGAIAGGAEVQWWDAADNRDRAWLWLDFPGNGFDADVARALVAAAREELRPLGRDLLTVDVEQGHPAAAWVESRGARHGSAEEHNVWRVADADRADVEALAGARPEGYELLSFGACPDDLLEPYTRLLETMNTAPRDDLTMEDWVYTPDRVRDWEAGLAARGHEPWVVVARSLETGELAGLNQLVVMPEWPETIENEDTAVAVPHRGHGLGLWLKAANLRRVLDERPDAVCVETWNAASNAHMLRVNRRLGFVCEHRWEGWEVPADALAAAP